MNNKLIKTAGFMAIATLLAKVCALLREMLIAYTFAGTFESDAYYVATQIPTTLFDMVIGGVISASFIPIYSGVLKNDGKEKSNTFANRFIGIVLFATSIITVLGMVFAGKLVSVQAPLFSAEAHELCTKLTAIMFPMLLFTALAFSFVGILQSNDEFNIPALISLISNVAVILYFPLFSKKFGIVGLSVSMVIAWSLQCAVQIPSLKKFGFKFLPSLKIDENVKSALLLALPMLISTWVQPLYSFVNTRLASGFSGAVSYLQYANRIYLVATGVFAFVVTNLVFPKMSGANSVNDKDEEQKLLVGSVKAVMLVIIPVCLLVITLSRPIISIIYERGSFTSDMTVVTASLLSGYSVGMLFFSLNELFSKTFFSRKNSKTPMINALISMVFDVIFAVVLNRFFPLFGLALATALASFVNALLNYLALKRSGKIFSKCDLYMFLKTVASAFISLVAVLTVKFFLEKVLSTSLIGNIVYCGVSSVVLIVVYIVMCILFKIDEVTSLFRKEDYS